MRCAQAFSGQLVVFAFAVRLALGQNRRGARRFSGLVIHNFGRRARPVILHWYEPSMPKKELTGNAAAVAAGKCNRLPTPRPPV